MTMGPEKDRLCYNITKLIATVKKSLEERNLLDSSSSSNSIQIESVLDVIRNVGSLTLKVKSQENIDSNFILNIKHLNYAINEIRDKHLSKFKPEIGSKIELLISQVKEDLQVLAENIKARSTNIPPTTRSAVEKRDKSEENFTRKLEFNSDDVKDILNSIAIDVKSQNSFEDKRVGQSNMSEIKDDFQQLLDDIDEEVRLLKSGTRSAPVVLSSEMELLYNEILGIVNSKAKKQLKTLELQLEELNTLKSQAVKSENFRMASEYKSKIVGLEHRIKSILKEDIAIQREFEKKLREEERKHTSNRLKELETLIKEITIKKEIAVEKEDFKTAHDLKIQLTQLMSEMNEKNRYIRYLEV